MITWDFCLCRLAYRCSLWSSQQQQISTFKVLRLHPPVPVEAKKAVEADVWPDGTKIPAGSEIVLSFFSQCRSENLWKQPSVLRPERWRYVAVAMLKHTLFFWRLCHIRFVCGFCTADQWAQSQCLRVPCLSGRSTCLSWHEHGSSWGQIVHCVPNFAVRLCAFQRMRAASTIQCSLYTKRARRVTSQGKSTA